MSSLRRRLRRLTALALLALFGWTLLPTLSAAFAGAGGPWGEICSAGALTRVSATGGGADLPAPAGASGSHCPLCNLPATLPPAPDAAVRARRVRDVPASIARGPDAPRRPRLRAQAPPRGPPGCS